MSPNFYFFLAAPRTSSGPSAGALASPPPATSRIVSPAISAYILGAMHHRRFSRRLPHSRRLLLRVRLARLARLSQPAVYRSYRPGGLGARPPSPPVAAFGEIETAHLAGFRSLRAWRWARRHGGFPEPVRRTPQGPIWTAAQIAQWLGDQLGTIAQPDQDQDALPAEMSEDEAALLAEIDRLELTA